jgi:peptidoglycan/LPS O-acetylase OafA/YrhL
MRAVAVAAVVLVHCALFGGMLTGSLAGRLLAHLNAGVTIFFEISGFLLYRPFIAHRTGGAAAPSLRDYAKRRGLRIYPAWWLVLTILLIVPGLPAVDYGHLWPMYTLTHTLPISAGPMCSQQVTRCGLAQSWSLVAEVTFYLALPAYAWIVQRLTRGLGVRAWVTVQVGLLAALSAASILVGFELLDPAPAWIGWSVVGNVLWFALGMAMAVASVAIGDAPRGRRLASWVTARSGMLWAAAVAVYVGLSLWLAPTPFLIARGQRLAVHLAFGVIALLALLPAIFTSGSPRLPQRIAGARAMGWVGLISYGIFLWHYAIVLTLGPVHGTGSFLLLLLATAAISTACAAASYYALERPLMKLKYRRA